VWAFSIVQAYARVFEGNEERAQKKTNEDRDNRNHGRGP
jgi:hypothetical protein